MRTISVEPQSIMKENIHHQCPDFDLVNGKYFSIGADWNKDSDEKVYAGDMMSVDLVPLLSTFESVLAYDLERGIRPSFI